MYLIVFNNKHANYVHVSKSLLLFYSISNGKLRSAVTKGTVQRDIRGVKSGINR
jgi:hypothetical protein